MRPVDYRKFRLKYLNTPEFSHVKLLLFWPVFGLLFAFVERVGVSNVYTPFTSPWMTISPSVSGLLFRISSGSCF